MMQYFCQCHECGKMVPVPSVEAQNYIMFHQIPCRACYEKGQATDWV